MTSPTLLQTPRSSGAPPQSPAPEAGRERDLALDFLRTISLLIVVLGHWMLAVVYWRDGALEAHNLLTVAPATQWATLILQPMAVFFMVGGMAGAASLSAGSQSRTATQWIAARIARLLGPVATYATFGVVVSAALAMMVPDAAAAAAGLLAMHLWFLAVFIPVTATIPWLYFQAARSPWRVPTMLGAAVVAVDVLRFVVGWGPIGWLNFAFVWLFFTSLGTAAHAAMPRRRDIAVVGMLAVAALAVVIMVGWYPHAMVGVGKRSNNTPPTVALMLLGLAQAAVAALVAPRLRGMLSRRHTLRHAMGVLNALSMHAYLWHLVAVIWMVWMVRVTGVGNIAPLRAAWWWTRPIWVAVLAACTALLVRVVVRFDVGRAIRASQQVHDDRWRVALIVVVASCACAVLALRSFGLGPVALLCVAAIHGAGVLVRHRNV